MQGFLKWLAEAGQFNSDVDVLHLLPRFHPACPAAGGDYPVYIWLTVLILSAQPPAPIEHRGAEAIYTTGFEQDVDAHIVAC